MQLVRIMVFLGLAVLAAAGCAASASEASVEHYNPMGRAISSSSKPPSIWEPVPQKTHWGQPHISPLHVEEMRGLCAQALAAQFPGRQDDYAFSTAGGSVALMAPPDIREAAGRYLGVLMTARRMEISLTLEHLALSRAAAARLDGLPGAQVDDETLAWLRAQTEPAREAALLGRLAAAGTAYEPLLNDNVTPVPTAYVRHEAGRAPELAYLSVTRGAWFSAQCSPSGPTRWQVSLRTLMAWNTKTEEAEGEVALGVGQTAILRKAVLRLPAWRSLAYRGDLTLSAGATTLLALAGASDDPAPLQGKPFEALLLRVDDVLTSAVEGPVAFCFDGSRIDPAVVLGKMRELAKADPNKPAVKAWHGSSMMLLADVSLRPLFLQAMQALLAKSEPQRLRVLLGGRMPEALPKRAAQVDAKTAAATAKAWWEAQGEQGLVSIASVAASSGSTAAQVDLQNGEVSKAGVGLAQNAASEGITLSAGCSGTGKRRRLALAGALGVPRGGLAGVPTTAVNVDRQLPLGEAIALPAGGRAVQGAVLAAQFGPLVEAENEAGVISQFQPEAKMQQQN